MPSTGKKKVALGKKGAILTAATRGPCNPACSEVFKLWTDREFPPSIGYSTNWLKVDGYRYINVFVEYSQESAADGCVDLNLSFALDANGKLSANNFLNMEENPGSPQTTVETMVKGTGTSSGGQHNRGSYVVRWPVMGPYCRAYVYNFTPVARKVSCWVYATS